MKRCLIIINFSLDNRQISDADINNIMYITNTEKTSTT